jgi:hypothetical protein
MAKKKPYIVTVGNTSVTALNRNEDGSYTIATFDGLAETTLSISGDNTPAEAIREALGALHLHTNAKPEYVKCEDEVVRQGIINHYEMMEQL